MAKKKQPKKQSKAAASPAPPKVDYVREDVNQLLPLYEIIRDCVDGEPAIKGFVGSISYGASGMGNGGIPGTQFGGVYVNARKYLPMPDETNDSAANWARYRAYVQRAVFSEVTGRTLEGMIGEIFLRDPVVELPKELQILIKDANGSGLTLDQVARRCCGYGIGHGRCGVLVDYPVTDGPATKSQIASGEIRPTICVYPPWDIINWRVERDEYGKERLTFLVLRESIEVEGEDGFSLQTTLQYRVLKLDDETGNHVVELYSKQGNRSFGVTDTLSPTDAKGKPLTELPFHFIGSEDNQVAPNRPPMYGLAVLNIAHYRNSADYEEAVFMAGQPTPVLAGLTEDWVKNVLNGEVRLGSRGAIPLPVGASATLLQAQSNSMPIEAMKHKEELMVAIGAKLIQNKKTAETATAKIIDTASESSTLASVSKNVSAALLWALGIAADFVGVAKAKIKYELNKDFDLTSMTADDQNAVILQWQSGAIDFTEMRTVLRRAGTATLSDDDARKKIKQDIADGIIPDPSLQNQPTLPTGGQTPKQPSSEGGPQPKPIRKSKQPGTTG